MPSLLKRYRDLILVAGLLLFPFATYLARGSRGRDPMLLDRGLLAVSSQVQRAALWVLDGGASLWQGYVALRGVEAENRGLREENRTLRASAQERDELRAENARLRELLAYAERSPGPAVVARVVGVDPSSTRHLVRIDRGQSDGVKRGMAVVTPGGVAGHVERATSGWADVLLITDATHRMGVRVERSRARAIAAGTGSKANLEVRLDYALRKDDLREGDVVVTSGTDGVYPPGLRVGVLSRVERKSFGMFQAAAIGPSVDPSGLEEVMVLPEMGPGLAPPESGPASAGTGVP